MKKTILTLTFAACSIFAVNASAVQFSESAKYYDLDGTTTLAEEEAWTLGNGNDIIRGVFNITYPNGDGESWDRLGFDPLTELLSQVEVAFAFKDEDSNKQIVRISLGSLFVNEEVAADTDSEFLYTTGSVLFGGNFWVNLQETGMVTWTVGYESDQGTPVRLVAAYLAADVTTVPDTGSTMALLGASVFGLALVGRRRVAA